jgi:hypothetical protein
MQTITSTHGVHVHADLYELTRIRHQLTASQLALWGDHSSRVAAMFGMTNNDIADLIFNDCGLVIWAVENPALGVAVAAGLTAIWSQLANLNALCDLVESRYQVGELTIDRKMALEHQLLEVAATAPFFAKLHLGGHSDADDLKKTPVHHPIVGPVVGPVIGPVVGPICEPVAPPTPVHSPTSARAPVAGGTHGSRSTVANLVNAGHGPRELQNSEQLKGAAGYKRSSTQN